jgi:DNA repair exonuclease SbcCD ATPase subunit
LNTDKITVNDALISTDVDKLIRIISERRRVSLNELEQLCNMDRRAIDKWVRVLEDEGYISVVYGLTGTNIVWMGAAQEIKHDDDDEINEALSSMTDKHSHEGYEEVVNTLATKEAVYDDTEKRLEDHLRKNREEEKEQERKDLKANILGSLDEQREQEAEAEKESDQPVAPEPEQDRKRDFEAAAKELVEEHIARGTEREEKESDVEPPSLREAPDQEEEPQEAEPAETRRPPKMAGDSAKAREVLNAYMNQINKEKAELERLKTEKDRLYRERYLALESKVEADLASVTERILEKEGRVLELKERVLELPDKVEEVEKTHRAIKKLESDGKEVLRKTRTDVDQFITGVASSRDEMERQMMEGRTKIDSEKARLGQLKDLSESVEAKLGGVKESLDATESQIAELNETMRKLLTDLEEATEMKVEISDMVSQVGDSITKKETELDELGKQMAEIEQVEQWVREYITDYERKVDEITEYVRASDDELATLRASAESAYLQKYIRELDDMTSVYDSAMHEASGEERDIDEKIDDAKRRMSSLVRDSKEMLQKLRADSSAVPDFETVRQTVEEKSGRVVQVLKEKEAERGKLLEDFQKARRGKPPAEAAPVRKALPIREYKSRLAAAAKKSKSAAKRKAPKSKKAKGKRRK